MPRLAITVYDSTTYSRKVFRQLVRNVSSAFGLRVHDVLGEDHSPYWESIDRYRCHNCGRFHER